MEKVDADIAEAIRLALAAGYDVEIKITRATDGARGRVRMPMKLVQMLAVDEMLDANGKS